MSKKFRSFSDFWPFYVREHLHPASRLLHVTGTLLAIILLAMCAASAKWSALPLVLVFGYGFAWTGHFVFERNRPATFHHPFYSLAGDFYMLYLTLTFRMWRELKRVQASHSED